MPASTRALLRKLDAVGWGLFFIWMGIAFLADVGWAVGLLGVGVIALGGQVARKYFGLRVEWFGLVMGLVLVVWSLGELLDIRVGAAPLAGSLLPVLCIVLGIVLAASALLRKPRH